MTEPRHRKHQRSVEVRIARTYRLLLSKVRAAKRALGTATETEAIEQALDMVVVRQELIDGTRRLFGIRIMSPDLQS